MLFYSYSDDYNYGRRHLFDKEFLETDCLILLRNGTTSNNTEEMTLFNYPPGTAVDTWFGTYMTNYLVAGIALMGAVLIRCFFYQQQQPSSVSTFTSTQPSSSSIRFFIILQQQRQRKQSILWYLIWFSIGYILAGIGHQFVTNTEPGNFDSSNSWIARVAYSCVVLSIPGLMLGILPDSCLLSLPCFSSSSSSSSLQQQQQKQQRQYFIISLLLLLLSFVGSITILVEPKLESALYFAGILIFLSSIILTIICSLTVILWNWNWNYCCSNNNNNIRTTSSVTNNNHHPNNHDTEHNNNDDDDDDDKDNVGGIDDDNDEEALNNNNNTNHQQQHHENNKGIKNVSSSSFSSSLSRKSCLLFAISQGIISFSIIVQSILSSNCGSKEAYENCFTDCPLPWSNYEYNHNFIYHILHGLGILFVIWGTILLPSSPSPPPLPPSR